MAGKLNSLSVERAHRSGARVLLGDGDGRTALSDGRSKWITGEAARQDVQQWTRLIVEAERGRSAVTPIRRGRV